MSVQRVSKDFYDFSLTPVIFKVYGLRLFVSHKVFLFRASFSALFLLKVSNKRRQTC